MGVICDRTNLESKSRQVGRRRGTGDGKSWDLGLVTREQRRTPQAQARFGGFGVSCGATHRGTRSVADLGVCTVACAHPALPVCARLLQNMQSLMASLVGHTHDDHHHHHT